MSSILPLHPHNSFIPYKFIHLSAVIYQYICTSFFRLKTTNENTTYFFSLEITVLIFETFSFKGQQPLSSAVQQYQGATSSLPPPIRRLFVCSFQSATASGSYFFFSKRNEDYMNKKAKNEIPRGEKLSRQSKTMSRNDKNIIDSLLEWNLIHLLEDIFLHLDVQSLTNAEQAFPDSWRPFIQGNSKLYHKKLATISSWFLRSSIKTSSVGNSKKKEKSQSRRNPLFRQPLGTTLMAAAPTLFQE